VGVTTLGGARGGERVAWKRNSRSVSVIPPSASLCPPQLAAVTESFGVDYYDPSPPICRVHPLCDFLFDLFLSPLRNCAVPYTQPKPPAPEGCTQVFDGMSRRDTVAWNAVTARYICAGCLGKAVVQIS
jgi:hypothetical protein